MLDVHSIIQAGGILAVAAIIFAESGILLGLFLPGDTLLLAAGLFAGQGKLNIFWLLLAVIIAAIVGYQVGYKFGEKAGPRIFKRKDGILFREEYIERTNRFFEKYGGATVVFGRFIAHVRTLISVVAGAGRMDRKAYLTYNVIGAILWGGGITMLGYLLGNTIPDVDQYFFPVVVSTLVAIYIFIFWRIARSPSRRAALKKGLREDWDYFFSKNKNT